MSSNRPGRAADQFPLRLPDGMRERIKAQADANGRSMNAEIVARLEVTFEQLGEYNALGIDALSKRLEGGVEAVEHVAKQLLGELRLAGGGLPDDDKSVRAALDKYNAAHGGNLGKTVHDLLKEALAAKGFLPVRAHGQTTEKAQTIDPISGHVDPSPPRRVIDLDDPPAD